MSEEETNTYLQSLLIRDQYLSLMKKIYELPVTRNRSLIITHLDESFNWFDRYSNGQPSLSDQFK